MMLLQWKKKIEKMKAHTLFKAAASIAKLSTQFKNTGEVEGGRGQQATEEAMLSDKDGAADKEQEL
jgi:hypothetical protein